MLLSVESKSLKILWDINPAAIQLQIFYKQLLMWGDYVDKIRPTLPQEVVEYPIKVNGNPTDADPLSLESTTNSQQPVSISFTDSLMATNELKPKNKRGRPRK